MALISALCDCGRMYQRIDAAEDFDRTISLAYCPPCLPDKPWYDPKRNLVAQPGWWLVNDPDGEAPAT